MKHFDNKWKNVILFVYVGIVNETTNTTNKHTNWLEIFIFICSYWYGEYGVIWNSAHTIESFAVSCLTIATNGNENIWFCWCCWFLVSWVARNIWHFVSWHIDVISCHISSPLALFSCFVVRILFVSVLNPHSYCVFVVLFWINMFSYEWRTTGV